MPEPDWTIRPGSIQHRRCWEDGCVVYDEFSGCTVFVDELGAALLERLHETRQTTASLIAWLAQRYDVDVAEIDRQDVIRRLRDLQALHLVQTGPQ